MKNHFKNLAALRASLAPNNAEHLEIYADALLNCQETQNLGQLTRLLISLKEINHPSQEIVKELKQRLKDFDESNLYIKNTSLGLARLLHNQSAKIAKTKLKRVAFPNLKKLLNSTQIESCVCVPLESDSALKLLTLHLITTCGRVASIISLVDQNQIHLDEIMQTILEANYAAQRFHAKARITRDRLEIFPTAAVDQDSLRYVNSKPITYGCAFASFVIKETRF